MFSTLRKNITFLISRIAALLPLSSKYFGPPKGFHVQSKDYVHSKKGKGAAYRLFQEATEIYLEPAPNTIGPEIHWRFNKNRRYILPEQYIIEIKNGRVVGSNCWIIGQDDRVIFDLSREFGVWQGNDLSILNAVSLPPIQKKKGRVAVAGYAGSDNYWHWMVNVLPRLLILQKQGLLETADAIVINELRHPFQQETIKFFNLREDAIIYSNRQLHLEAELLIIPSPPEFIDHLPRETSGFLRNMFASCLNGPQDKRFYISRNKAVNRKILNEEALIALLRNLNFEIIELENRSVVEQAQLFSRASVIVAPHGASQTNILFCSPGTKVIELFSPLWVHYCYYALSTQLQLDYYYLIGEGDQITEENYRRDKGADIQIDPNLLLKLLREAGVDNRL